MQPAREKGRVSMEAEYKDKGQFGLFAFVFSDLNFF